MNSNPFKQLIYNLGKFKLSIIRKFLNISLKKDVKRGFVIIQIDGLSHKTLQHALQNGYLPNIKKYILNGKFKEKNFYSGFPSNTPNFQKQIMFGDDEPLPGFRWYDKFNKIFYTFTSPETAEYMEKAVKNKNNIGILKGGVSYYNLFSGDADRSYLTLSKIFHTNLKVRLTGFKLFLLIFLNFFTITKIIFLGIKEIFREIKDKIYFYFNDLSDRDFIFFPLLRVFNNVIINEYITNAVCLEILSGTPKIYVTFNAYDEISHQRGPFHRGSLKTLKAIDKSILKIYKFVTESTLRRYDIYILSDHGEAPSLPFFKLFKKQLKDIVLKYREHLEVAQHGSQVLKSESFNVLVLKKIKSFALNAEIPKILSKFILKKGEMSNILEKFQSKQISLISFGPVSHLYFTGFYKKLDFNEINNEFPLLIFDILTHKSIGAIALQDGTTALLLFKNGSVKILNGEIKFQSFKGETFDNDFANLFIKEILNNASLRSDIEKTTMLKHSGDLIIFSNFIMNGVVNFEDQMSCHGGIGQGQTDAFVIFPKHQTKKFSTINAPTDLYRFFKTNY